jgi:hypothetical protein
MAKDSLSQYSTTAASNTDVHSVSIAEGMAPSDVNNAIREIMVDLAHLCAGTQHLNALDINGGELKLDADGDTSITADTDDQIDFKIAGADDFRMTANTLSVLSGTTLNIDSGATIANSGTATGFGSGATANVAVTYNVATATGSLAVTGFGFAPASLILHGVVGAADNVWNYGVAKDGVSQLPSHFGRGTTAADQADTHTVIWRMQIDGSNYAEATVSSWDADGITFSITKVGSPTGYAKLLITGFKS